MPGVVSKLKIAFIAADAVEHGLRNVLTGEPHQMLKNIELKGSAEHKTSVTEGGNETKIRAWVSGQAKKCAQLKLEAEKLDYPFFDISTVPFEQYIAAAQQYFLES